MRGKQVLFQDPDPKALRVAERALNATGSAVSLIESPAGVRTALASTRFDLLMLNLDSLMREDASWLDSLSALDTHWPRTPLVLHTIASTEKYLPLMAGRSFLRNMIAKRGDPLEPDELIITAEKLLRQDLFGLQKYLLWGVEPYCVPIADSTRKQRYIRTVSDYATLLGCNARVIEMIETVVDELVTNAIYNAPRRQDGTPKYAQLSRREAVVLEQDEVGELQFACDGSYIAIAQRDPFGALTRDTVVSYLTRCLDKGPNQLSDTSGGAGIGLFQVFQSLSKFIINIDPGHRTEVICLIDLRLNMRRFHEVPKSFHVFIADRQGPGGER
jgi:hypothetical protein